MYVSCLGMQFMQRAGYVVRTVCETFVVHLAYYSVMDNEDDEESSRRLATLDTLGCFPPVIWQLRNYDPCSPWDSGHYAVHLSLLGRSSQLTRLWHFFQLGFQLLTLHHIHFFERCCGAKKGMWYGGQGLKFMTSLSLGSPQWPESQNWSISITTV